MDRVILRHTNGQHNLGEEILNPGGLAEHVLKILLCRLHLIGTFQELRSKVLEAKRGTKLRAGMDRVLLSPSCFQQEGPTAWQVEVGCITHLAHQAVGAASP